MGDVAAVGTLHTTPLRPQLPVVLPLLEKRRDTPSMATLFFPVPAQPEPSFDLPALVPGQFVMVWLRRVDEKPYAISYLDGERFGITVMRRGPFSSHLHEIEPGALVGFRGPYGRGFWGWENLTKQSGDVVLAGGCGLASLALLAEKLPRASVIQGVPTAEEVLYAHRFPQQIVCTEDGARGRKGLPTEWLAEALERGEVCRVYTCGPEAMLAAVVEMCHEAGVPCQASLERYMKCGFGVCGQCECDGRLVCQDGPVFSGEELGQMPSFGSSARLKTGRKVPLAEYAQCGVPPRPSKGAGH